MVMNHTSDQHPWFQETPPDPRQPEGRLVRLERRRPEVVRSADHLRRHRAVELDLRPAARAVLLAPLLPSSARPELRQSRGPGGDARRRPLLARSRARRLPARRGAVPVRAGRHQRREPPGDARLPEADPPDRRSRSSRAVCSWPRPTSGRPTSCSTSARESECHMCFHFPLMPRMFMAIRRSQRYPITEILAQTPDIPDGCQWGIFLRNHDELTLEMVTDEERDYMYAEYATDPQMRRNIGISRRLFPLLENDRRIAELFHALLFSMPGSPGPLLRRRDRHGRQHLPRRPRRRAHADAVDARSQRRLQPRRLRAAVPAAARWIPCTATRRSTWRARRATRRRSCTGCAA